MAFAPAPSLDQRIRRFFDAEGIAYEAKRMMGGLCFMVDGKMCIGVLKDRLIARLDPAAEGDALRRPGCGPMDFTGRPMKGFVFVDPIGSQTAADLAAWLNLALEFNPNARASKKKHR